MNYSHEMFTFQWKEEGSTMWIKMKHRRICGMVQYLALNSNLRLMMVCKKGRRRRVPSKKVRHLVEGLFGNMTSCV